MRDIPGNVGIAPQTTLPNSATMRIGGGSLYASTTVTATVVEPRLTMAKTLTPNYAALNDIVTITLVVTNTGTSTAYDTTIGDPLPNAYFSTITEGTTPAGFAFSTISAPPTTTVQYTGGSLTAGSSATFTFNVTLASGVTVGQLITNTASITQATTLPGADANERNEPPVSASAPLTVTVPDISIGKTDGVTSVLPGQTLVYTITVNNVGGRDATGIVLTDTLPANTTFVGASGTYTNTGGTLTWASFDLAATMSTTRLVTVTVAKSFTRRCAFHRQHGARCRRWCSRH